MAMIEVSHLEKDFRKTIKAPGLLGSFKSLIHPQYQTFEAVKDLSFEVPQGEILGFIGANGAGKSTTIKMLTGILTPTSGFCRINGKIPQEDRKNYVKDIGVVFGQRTQLWWDLPLQETYSVLKEIYDVPEKDFYKRMDFLNEILDLNEFITSPVRTLSLGQRMRADIAASLLHNPKVLFLDEPTIGLDVSVKDNIRKAIAQINQEEHTTIVLTTHDLDDIELLCDRIFMIDRGAEVFDGTIKQLKDQFGRMREVEFELVDPEAGQKLNYESLSSPVTVNQTGNTVTAKFDDSLISVPEILQLTLAQVEVKDISVKEIDIEEVVRQIFRKEAQSHEQLS